MLSNTYVSDVRMIQKIVVQDVSLLLKKDLILNVIQHLFVHSSQFIIITRMREYLKLPPKISYKKNLIRPPKISYNYTRKALINVILIKLFSL